MLEETITKHGNLSCLRENQQPELQEMMEKLEGFNKVQLFSHAKRVFDTESRSLESIDNPLPTKI